MTPCPPDCASPHFSAAATTNVTLKHTIARFTIATGVIDTSTTSLTSPVLAWRSAMTNGTSHWGAGNAGQMYFGPLGSTTPITIYSGSPNTRGSAVFSDSVLGTSLWVSSSTQVRAPAAAGAPSVAELQHNGSWKHCITVLCAASQLQAFNAAPLLQSPHICTRLSRIASRCRSITSAMR